MTTEWSQQLWEQLTKLEVLNAPVCIFSVLGKVPPSGCQGREDFNQRNDAIKCMLQKGP